jgi:hypothetical protein
MLAVVILIANAAMAQAGRHVPKPSQTPATPQPTPEPTVTPKPAVKPEFTLKVMTDITMNTYMDFLAPERMPTWVVDRLKKVSLLDVSTGAPVNRAEAAKLARAETQAFIVWLQLEEDQLSRNPGNRAGSGEVWINYYVFAPVSGKTKTWGRVVLSQAGRKVDSSPNVLRSCYPGLRSEDYFLLQASLEVATRIIEHFDLPVPPVCG